MTRTMKTPTPKTPNEKEEASCVSTKAVDSEKAIEVNLSDEDLFRDVLHKVLDNNKAAANQVLKAIDYEFKLFLTANWEEWCSKFSDTTDNKAKTRDQIRLKRFHKHA